MRGRDLYSVGVILFEMLAGQRPFAGEAVTLLRQHVLGEVPDLPPAAQASADPRIAAMVRRLLAKKLEDRFCERRRAARSPSTAASGRAGAIGGVAANVTLQNPLAGPWQKRLTRPNARRRCGGDRRGHVAARAGALGRTDLCSVAKPATTVADPATRDRRADCANCRRLVQRPQRPPAPDDSAPVTALPPPPAPSLIAPPRPPRRRPLGSSEGGPAPQRKSKKDRPRRNLRPPAQPVVQVNVTPPRARPRIAWRRACHAPPRSKATRAPRASGPENLARGDSSPPRPSPLTGEAEPQEALTLRAAPPRGAEAEREGFEPSVPLRVHMISNHAPSATRSSLPGGPRAARAGASSTGGRQRAVRVGNCSKAACGSLTSRGSPATFRGGELSEWPKEPDSKSGVPVRVPWVRIPRSPLQRRCAELRE